MLIVDHYYIRSHTVGEKKDLTNTNDWWMVVLKKTLIVCEIEKTTQ